MSRYIDAEIYPQYDDKSCFATQDDYIQLGRFRKLLNALPTADVAEVKHGRWEFIGGYGYQYRCSKCFMCHERRTPYCPNCGAKMDEVEE